MFSDKPTFYYLKASTICLTIIAAGVATAFLVYTKSLMIPLVISIFLYTILAQMTLYMKQKFSFPSWLAMTISILLCLAAFVGVVLFTANSVGTFLKGAEVYRQNLIATINDIALRLQQHGITLDQNFIETYLRELPLFNWLKNFGGKVFNIVSDATLVILFMTFFLFGSKKTPPITNPAINAKSILAPEKFCCANTLCIPNTHKDRNCTTQFTAAYSSRPARGAKRKKLVHFITFLNKNRKGLPTP